MQPWRILLLPVISVLVAESFRLVIPRPWIDPWLARAVVAASAGLIGCPALVWALDGGRTRLWQFLCLGAIAGVVPLLIALGSAVIGQTVRGGFSYLEQVLSRGASLPWFGMVPWRVFLYRLETHALLVGLTSAAVYWLLLVDRRLPWASRWALAGGSLALATAIARSL